MKWNRTDERKDGLEVIKISQFRQAAIAELLGKNAVVPVALPNEETLKVPLDEFARASIGEPALSDEELRGELERLQNEIEDLRSNPNEYDDARLWAEMERQEREMAELSDKAIQSTSELRAEIDEMRKELTNNILDLSLKSPFFAADENWSGKPVGENIAVKVNQRIGTICFDKYGNLGFISQHYHLGMASLIVISSGFPSDDTELKQKLEGMERKMQAMLQLFNSVTGMYFIEVENGTADPEAAFDGKTVTLTWNGEGTFKEWVFEPDVELVEGASQDSTVKFKMPKDNVRAKAVLAEVYYAITVENGFAEPNEAKAGEAITVTAVEPISMQQSIAKPSLKTLPPSMSVIRLQPVSKLYTLQEAIAACPEGWHVPSREEWQELFNFAGENAGKKLKAASGWNEDGNGTDDFGFNAVPENYNDTGYIYGSGTNAIWWSSSPRLDDEGSEAEGKIAVFGLYYASDYVGGYDFDDTPSLSVRLVKDDGEMPIMGLFMDERDGKTYTCAQIGEQVWMAENLNYAEVANG
jgi:uncharacterized protein (TIGR02145 family)